MNETNANWRDIFEKSGAFLKGHFCLSSGLHSAGYFQSALLLKDPKLAELCAKNLLKKLASFHWNVVVGPAMGSLIIGHEMAKHSETSFLFMEREQGKLTFRRGFSLNRNDRVLLIEDVITTGGSVGEILTFFEKAKITVVAVAAIVDRSGGSVSFPVPFVHLTSVSLETYDPQMCPMCRKSEKLLRLGSRSLKS